MGGDRVKDCSGLNPYPTTPTLSINFTLSLASNKHQDHPSPQPFSASQKKNNGPTGPPQKSRALQSLVGLFPRTLDGADREELEWGSRWKFKWIVREAGSGSRVTCHPPPPTSDVNQLYSLPTAIHSLTLSLPSRKQKVDLNLNRKM